MIAFYHITLPSIRKHFEVLGGMDYWGCDIVNINIKPLFLIHG
jgi:hypothetical protein